MKTLWLWLLLLLAALALFASDAEDAPCDSGRCPAVREAPPAGEELTPVVDLPRALRTSNWGGGSCVHASTVHLLQWQGQHQLAQWWRTTFSGGEYASRLHGRLEAAGLRYAYTTEGDIAFLEWALRTRRGAGITYFPNHAVNLVHLDAHRAGLLDNNRIDHIVWIRRDEFLRNWRAYGGWAWTLVYNPPPPPPYVL
jgi:hypothetical protein